MRSDGRPTWASHSRLTTWGARGWSYGLWVDATCALSAQERETVDHLLIECVHSRETWFTYLYRCGIQYVAPLFLDIAVSWLETMRQVAKPLRKGFDMLVVPVSKCLWKEHNNKIFTRKAIQPMALAQLVIKEEGLYGHAGFAKIALLLVRNIF
ncbi:hypothetical protein BS78_09G118100 [Paspalum vaginatum]|nr:hypothetical protein BS78_09G118100 [Paspalum vaginatum]